MEPSNPDREANETPRTPPLPDAIFALHTAAMREASEPRDGISPTPISFILLCMTLTMWGGWYLGGNGGDWSATGMSEQAVAGPAGPMVAQDPLVLGQEVFNNCMQCHQASGLGVAGSYPPLAGSEYVVGDTRRLAAILLNGLAGDIVVTGQTFNSKMPAWQQLTDEEIAAVLTHIRRSWGNQAGAVPPALVAAVRKEIGAKGEWTATTLEAFAKSAPLP